MDGYTLSRDVRELIKESSSSAWLDTRTTYDYIYQAVLRFVERTECLTASGTITTVVETSAYNLPADFLGLYLRDSSNKYFIKYNDGTSTYFVSHRDYEGIVFANNTTSVDIPDRFSIIDNSTLPTTITSTTTSAGAASNGECTLNKTAGGFTTTVSVGDAVHNITDGSHGVVIAVTSATALQTCLFDGTTNAWGSGDTYLIVPQPRLSLIVDPLSKTASHTITVNYVQKPAPVYSPYKTYRIRPEYHDAIVYYAAFLYKYRDSAANFGDAYYKRFDEACRVAARSINKVLRREGFKVNFMKRGLGDSSFK